MLDVVASALKRLGPVLSTVLVAELVRLGLTPANARQKVSRSTSIKKLAYLPFRRNARFVYLADDYGSPDFWSALTKALIEHTSGYGGALASLMARGGIMPVAHFAIACGAPIRQKKHLAASTILERLTKAELTKVYDVPGVGQCVELAQQTLADTSTVAKLRARLRTEEILLAAVRDWLRNLGLVSFGAVDIRDESSAQPRVGTFNWDLTAPSYLPAFTSLENKSTLKPGFVACDVLTGINVSVEALEPFLNKCKTLRALPKVGRCLQILVADGYTKDAFQRAKNEGIVPATIETLFGTDVAAALRELTSLLADTYHRPDTFAKVDEVFKRLTHIEGAALNLRGTLFEFLAAETVRLGTGLATIRLNEQLRHVDGRGIEVDVLAVRHDHDVTFIECKGYKPGGLVPDEAVDRWLDDRIHLLNSIADEERFWRNCRRVFEYWTTGRLSPEAQEKFARAAQTKKYDVVLVDSDEVQRRVNATNNAALKRTLKQHFREHPLEAAEAAAKRSMRRLPIPQLAQLRKRGAD
jgi:hypothetical protein